MPNVVCRCGATGSFDQAFFRAAKRFLVGIPGGEVVCGEIPKCGEL